MPNLISSPSYSFSFSLSRKSQGIPLLYKLDAQFQAVCPFQAMELTKETFAKGYTWATSRRYGFQGKINYFIHVIITYLILVHFYDIFVFFCHLTN